MYSEQQKHVALETTKWSSKVTKILVMSCEGLDNKAIATALGINYSDVSSVKYKYKHVIQLWKDKKLEEGSYG